MPFLVEQETASNVLCFYFLMYIIFSFPKELDPNSDGDHLQSCNTLFPASLAYNDSENGTVEFLDCEERKQNTTFLYACGTSICYQRLFLL
jgi:hypothetical protein